jgi:DNA-binding transcriptional LysR family regulator
MRIYYGAMSNLGRQIEAFRAVMLTGGMTTAAHTLNVTQPAISRLIRDLEADLNITLFHRKGNQIMASSEATAFFAEVERSYLGLEQLKAYASDLRRSQSGTLRVAALPAMSFGFLPYCLAKFGTTRPRLSIVLDGVLSHYVVERVMGGQYEVGFAETPADRPMVRAVPINAPVVVALPADHPLADYATISPAQLDKESIIMLSRGSYMRHLIGRAIGDRADTQRTIETQLSSAACAMVAQRLGLAIVDPFTAVAFLNSGLVFRPFRPRIDIGLAMVTDKYRPLSQIAEQFAASVPSMAEDYLSLLGHR